MPGRVDPRNKDIRVGPGLAPGWALPAVTQFGVQQGTEGLSVPEFDTLGPVTGACLPDGTVLGFLSFLFSLFVLLGAHEPRLALPEAILTLSGSTGTTGCSPPTTWLEGFLKPH